MHCQLKMHKFLKIFLSILFLYNIRREKPGLNPSFLYYLFPFAKALASVPAIAPSLMAVAICLKFL